MDQNTAKTVIHKTENAPGSITLSMSVVASDVQTIQSDMGLIANGLQEIQEAMLTKEDILKKIADINKEIKLADQRSKRWDRITMIVYIILTIVMAYLTS